jgi:hypothetical protein
MQYETRFQFTRLISNTLLFYTRRKDSLGGNCRTLLIACVWPDESQNDQTIATLRFATRMMRVKTSAVINVQEQQGKSLQEMLKYVDEIKRLKGELAMHDTLSGRHHISYDVPNVEQVAEMRQDILAFIEDPTKELCVLNVVQVKTMFQLFRELMVQKRHYDQPHQDNHLEQRNEPQKQRREHPEQPLYAVTATEEACKASESTDVPETTSADDNHHDMILMTHQANASHINVIYSANNDTPSSAAPVAAETTSDTESHSFDFINEYKHLMEVQMEDAKQNFRKAKKKMAQCANDVNVAKRYKHDQKTHTHTQDMMNIDGFAFRMDRRLKALLTI